MSINMPKKTRLAAIVPSSVSLTKSLLGYHGVKDTQITESIMSQYSTRMYDVTRSRWRNLIKFQGKRKT